MRKTEWVLTIAGFALAFAGGATAATAIMHFRDGAAKRGQTMAEVRSAFGEPVSVIGPVGTPPVTKWTMASGEVVVFLDNYAHDAFVVTQ